MRVSEALTTRRGRVLVPISLTAVLMAVGAASVASAAIPSASDGVIHGCYKRPGLLTEPGALRVIDTEQGQTCRANETPLDWNQRGPAGPAGPAAATTVFFASQAPYPNRVTIFAHEDVATILRLVLPPGSYLAEADLTVGGFTEGSMTVNCLLPGADEIAWTGTESGLVPDREMTIKSAFVHTEGAVELRCRKVIGLATDALYVRSATLLVTKVDAVNPGSDVPTRRP